VREPILILGSLYPFDSHDVVLEHNLIPTVASRSSAHALAQRAHRRGRPAACHVKIDTGMGRIGMSPATAREALLAIRHNPWLKVEGVYTHLACADSATATAQQLRLFETTLAGRPQGRVLRHAANSGGALLRPASHYDVVRPGILLYGAPPWAALEHAMPLRPVLTWKTRVVFIKSISRGTPVSYGWTWRARRRSRVATLPVGYADGYRRDLSNRANVLVKRRRCPVVGRVTMDQIMVDVTDWPGVDVGEEVVLLGRQGREQVTATEMAAWAGTLPYEILCGISKRVPRVFRGAA
jgi:alanine racemase